MVVHENGSPSDEARALARLTFDELGRGPGGIWAIHRTIAQRAFRAVGPGARGVQMAHDTISGAVYGGLRGATSFVGRGAAATVSSAQPLSTSPRGSAVL